MVMRRYSHDQHMGLYEGRPISTEYQRFSSDFFTGADVRIYFGDTWVDEVTGLAFSVQENVQPIYGYASYTYDAVARGARQIQGQFSINFKESYYLHSITNRLELKLREQKENGYAWKASDGYGERSGKTASTKPVNTQQLMKSVTDDASFEKYATMYEKTLWGEQGYGSDTQGMRELVHKRQNHSFFAPANKRPNVAKEGFSIMVLYGPEPGLKQSYSSGMEDISRTAHSLVGVHLTGVTQQIDSSGQPLQETYTFIAQDIDWNINLDKNAD